VVGVGVQQHLGVRHHADMALPEHQVAALKRVPFDILAKRLGLLVAVARAVRAAGPERQLHEARAVEAPAAGSAPQIGRAEEQVGHAHGVVEARGDGHQVLARDEMARLDAVIPLPFRRYMHRRAEEQRDLGLRLEIRRG
jgi:hypothetical protein